MSHSVVAMLSVAKDASVLFTRATQRHRRKAMCNLTTSESLLRPCLNY